MLLRYVQVEIAFFITFLVVSVTIVLANAIKLQTFEAD